MFFVAINGSKFLRLLRLFAAKIPNLEPRTLELFYPQMSRMNTDEGLRGLNLVSPFFALFAVNHQTTPVRLRGIDSFITC